MISIAPTGYHPDTPLTVPALPGSDLESVPIRMSRVATLDGGCVIDHRGQCDGDRILVIKTRLTWAQSRSLNSMLALYQEFVVSCREGLFLGAFENRAGTGGAVTLRFLVTKQLDGKLEIELPPVLPLDPDITPGIAYELGAVYDARVDEHDYMNRTERTVAIGRVLASDPSYSMVIGFVVGKDLHQADAITVSVFAEVYNFSHDNPVDYDLRIATNADICPASYAAYAAINWSSAIPWSPSAWTPGAYTDPTPDISSLLPYDWAAGDLLLVKIDAARCTEYKTYREIRTTEFNAPPKLGFIRH